jgi:phosphopantothenoylcysteine decarboxylase/phosphopantothenate--cysteine ligase
MSEVLLGVGGGIAAYKSCDLLRRLQDQGHQVTVIPTPASLNFVGKATWEALSGRKVHSEVWDTVHNVNHVQLGDQADYILVAPATADLIARLAVGRADDLLTNAILASNAPKMLVPAMHPKMWLNEATQKNVLKLREIGFVIMEPAVGKLTGGDVGIGRFPDTAEILEAFNTEVVTTKDLTGVKILVTAGGTREAIDDVRFIGNRSSGKQGIAIASNAKARGAQVTLIAANIETKKLANLFGVTCYSLENTEQLRNKLLEEFPKCQVLIMAAAVSDARPNQLAGKVKKDDYRELQLIQNPDLLVELSKIRTKQVIVGFAAEESANLLQEGTRKLQSKGLDLIYANDIDSGQLFGSDKTSGFFIHNSGYEEIHPMTKQALAVRLLDKVLERLNSANV